MGILRIGNKWLAWGGNILSMPVNLYTYICNAFSYGWDRNRAIDTLGTHNNALMGGYLLAASNTTITIQGLRVTGQDLIVPLTPNGLVGVVNVTNTMTFTAGSKYGAFEVYRAGTLLGRYCLTERQGLQIINQVTGGLPNGLLGGTITTVWQRSNAFYCETNHTGYSISGTGWVTSSGAALTIGTIVPADPANPTKCMAWVSSVQQDLQFVGKARNSVSVVPAAFYCNADRHWNGVNFGATVTTHKLTVYCIVIKSATAGVLFGSTGNSSSTTARSLVLPTAGIVDTVTIGYYNNKIAYVSLLDWYGVPLKIEGGYNNGLVYTRVTNLNTGQIRYTGNQYTAGTIAIASSQTRVACSNTTTTQRFTGYIMRATEEADGVVIDDFIACQQTTSMYDLKAKTTHTLQGISTNISQNIDLVYNAYNQTGYELWYNGTDYQIYPLASDGATIITPVGYTSQGKVTAGNMPSVADSRMSTFKYALANSYALRQSVPEAFDATDPCAPKLLTYSELSALSANPKVTKIEADGKITNIKIK